MTKRSTQQEPVAAPSSVRGGRGRPLLPEDEVMAPVTIYLKPSQRVKLQRLGGAAWVRQKIDGAKEPPA